MNEMSKHFLGAPYREVCCDSHNDRLWNVGGGRIARSAVMAAGHFPLRTSRHDRFAAASGRQSVVIACRRSASACNESR